MGESVILSSSDMKIQNRSTQELEAIRASPDIGVSQQVWYLLLSSVLSPTMKQTKYDWGSRSKTWTGLQDYHLARTGNE